MRRSGLFVGGAGGVLEARVRAGHRDHGVPLAGAREGMTPACIVLAGSVVGFAVARLGALTVDREPWSVAPIRAVLLAHARASAVCC